MAKRKILTRNNCTIKLEKHSAIKIIKNGLKAMGRRIFPYMYYFRKEYSYVVKPINGRKNIYEMERSDIVAPWI